MERSISHECPPRLCHQCFLSGSKPSLSYSPSCCQLTCGTARKPNKAVKSVFAQKTLPAHCKILWYFAAVRCGDGVSAIVTQGVPLGFHHSVSVSSCWMLFQPFFYLLIFFSLLFFMCQIPGLVCSELWCFAPGEHSALSTVGEFDPSPLCIHGIMVGWAADQIGSERGESVLFHFLGTDGWQYFCVFYSFVLSVWLGHSCSCLTLSVLCHLSSRPGHFLSGDGGHAFYEPLLLPWCCHLYTVIPFHRCTFRTASWVGLQWHIVKNVTEKSLLMLEKPQATQYVIR